MHYKVTGKMTNGAVLVFLTILHSISAKSAGDTSSVPDESLSSDDMDFTSTSWITNMNPDQTITRLVDENVFIITADKNVVYINSFPVNVQLWEDALNGKAVKLSSNGKEGILTSTGENVLLDGKSITDGKKICTEISLNSVPSTEYAMTGQYMDFSTSAWMTKLVEGERVTRIVDGNIFNILSASGNKVFINGFPVTVADWDQALNGKQVTLTSNGSQASLNVAGKNVMFNGKSLTDGEKISTRISFDAGSSVAIGGQANMDFSSSSWMASIADRQTVKRTVDGNIFTITSSGNVVYINGFPVTVDQWHRVLNGEKVKLSFNGKEAILTSIGSNILFNGLSMTNGSQISNQVSSGVTSSTSSNSIISGPESETMSTQTSTKGDTNLSNEFSNIDVLNLSSTSWMESLAEGQTVTRTVDGNVFTITSSGNVVYINGFPVTVDQWHQVLEGKKVELSFQGKKAILSSIGSNIMLNGISITNGSSISTKISFGTIPSSSTGIGNIDFSTPDWMSSLVEGQTVTRNVDGNVFTITSSGNMIYINGFPVTVDQWNQVLSGKAVKLSFQGKEATLSSIGSNIMFNGNSMTTGSSMANHVSFGHSSSSNMKTDTISTENLSQGNSWEKFQIPRVNIDFGSSLWLSSMFDGQQITRTVDGNIFTITSSGNVVYINGFPVTADQWNQALSGKEVILSFQGTEAILKAIGSNVMFNGKSLTTGSSISTQVSYGKSASSSSNFFKAGDLDFSSSSWLSSMVDGQRITRTVDGNTFEIVSSANVIYINGFPVTTDQWNQVLNGKEVRLSFHGKEAILSSIGSNIMFNGKSLTTGRRMSNQISYGLSSSSNSMLTGTGGESLSSQVIGENFGQNSGFLNNGNMDFSSSSWMSSMVDGQTVTRIVDGNVFTILFSGNVVYINGFPVTADQWNQALNGLEVKLSFQGKQATLSSIGSNVMFNGKSMTNGSTMSSHSSFGSTSSLNTNIFRTDGRTTSSQVSSGGSSSYTGGLDFSSSSWMSSLVDGQTITRTVDGNIFEITSYRNMIYINGFPVTVEQWNQALAGETVIILYKGKQATLVFTESNMLFNGKSITDGSSVSNHVSYGSSSSSSGSGSSSSSSRSSGSSSSSSRRSGSSSSSSRNTGSSSSAGLKSRSWSSSSGPVIDFSSSSWMSSLAEGQTITRTVDGNVFTITSSGNNVYINGFPVTVDQWHQVLRGSTVTLMLDGKTAELSASGSNIMFNGQSLTEGGSISTQISFNSAGRRGNSHSSSQNLSGGLSSQNLLSSKTDRRYATKNPKQYFDLSNSGNIDFSSSSWMSIFQDGQKVTRTIDGNVFVITSSGNMIYINGFPVTVDQWNQVLNGKKVNLSFQGKKARLSSIGSNIMFNGKSMTNGSRISNQVSFSSTSRASTPFSSSGNLDLSSSSWMSNLAKGQIVTRTVDGNVFTLTSSGDIGFINGFPVTKDEWDQALAGKKVTLTSVGEKAVLSSTGTNIMFNGKSLTKGNSISTQISSRSTTKSNSRLAGSSSSSIILQGEPEDKEDFAQNSHNGNLHRLTK
ncbi:uncharacterized protein LOC111699020 isoform X5 [Eurytemora carolleeae]|uniref:uncharacterized protein LOC111699020 isoform X5 n=1 Tax=Eurytemora carolleeae TaxID=1294199 RepID=UPI000C78A1B5|nr:uncharacterized protein LOC111699020 isoform X5 [Eurytemora carolleeae]|eukprot:XP_023325317.1 uncharacterized protein LOC111699020 isoform X5 [Eurytemora affinis]